MLTKDLPQRDSLPDESAYYGAHWPWVQKSRQYVKTASRQVSNPENLNRLKKFIEDDLKRIKYDIDEAEATSRAVSAQEVREDRRRKFKRQKELME